MTRPPQHEIDEKGDALFRLRFAKWGVNPSEKDYGWDYVVELFREHKSTGHLGEAPGDAARQSPDRGSTGGGTAGTPPAQARAGGVSAHTWVAAAGMDIAPHRRRAEPAQYQAAARSTMVGQNRREHTQIHGAMDAVSGLGLQLRSVL